MTDTAPTMDYKETLNLPQTAFKMKAGAATREPELQQFWESERVYETIQAHRKQTKAGRFLLHDGPPYLSSDKIHIGTALNKILKDIVTRYQTMTGHYSPYVPGYDGHGLPIENAVVKSIKGGRAAITPLELRKQCRTFALKNLNGQKANFKRLGVWGDWEHPYVTIDGPFEATQIKLFWQMYQKGYVYKGLKPVYWCSQCETALADAEVEYADHVSESVYVRFPATDMQPQGLPNSVIAQWQQVGYVIWTTTPWTLPANLGLAFHPDLDYVFLQTETHGILVLAQALLESFLAQTQLQNTTVLGTLKGAAFENLTATHPLYPRTSKAILGEHVTAEAGTGIVHTAPGHGHEDYLAGQHYNLGILSPLNGKGVFTEEAGERFAGVFYEKANPMVIDALEAEHALLAKNKLNHSYPHCWRCHNPVIYRATEQWFINVDGFRKQALDEIKQVSWIPARGEHRITSMVENRSDWCISRQRVWGVPIPVLYCSACRKPLINNQTIAWIAERFEQETSDCWWEYDAKAFLKSPVTCDCGNSDYEKEMDIMDVWFDSGVTHTAVVEARHEELGHLPVELYLEGSDQHRGWFQSALLTSVATRGERPYKSVLTHGFVLDPDGRKMSKSLGNVVDPQDVIRELGADVLRLWVASVDYTNDVRIGKEILSQLADIYRKVRNTIRFILGNLHGFNAQTDCVPYAELSLLDQYILHRSQWVVETLTEAFNQYEFHRYYQVLQNFCVTDLSALYFDVTKDVLYTAKTDSLKRRAVQTVLFELLSTLTPILVPVMPHLAEDIWQAIPEEHKPTFGQATPPNSILMAPWPTVNTAYVSENRLDMSLVLSLRELTNLALEPLRAEGLIGSALEAEITFVGDSQQIVLLKERVGEDQLAALLLVSRVYLTTEKPLSPHTYLSEALDIHPVIKDIYISKATGNKCTRCWKYLPSVGQHSVHTQLCHHCVEAITLS